MNRKQRLGTFLVAAVVLVSATTPTTPTTPAKPKIDRGPLLTGAEVKTIKVKKGEQVRFRVRSSVAEELHVHGYDLSRPLKPGVTVPVSFKATIEGIFELEFEQSGTPIASLEVQP